MVVEHVFVTTLGATDAMRMAAEFLASRGFINSEQSAFQVGQTEWTALEMRRGRKTASHNRGVLDRPHSVRLEYDRGRVVVAASIDARTRSFWMGTGRELSSSSTRAQPYVNLLMTITQSLEQLLANGRSPEQAAAPWTVLDSELAASDRTYRRRRVITLWIATIFAVSMVALMIFAITSMH